MTTTLMRDSFDRFGDDLVGLLLSSMTNNIRRNEDKWKLQLVSKQWQRLIFNGQTDIVFDNISDNFRQTVRLFAAILPKCCSMIETVVIRNHQLSEEIVDLLVRHCRRLRGLRHLCLSSYCLDGNDVNADRLLATFGPQLQSFQLLTVSGNYHQVVNKLVGYLPGIKKLVVGGGYYNSQLVDIRHYFTDDTGVCVLPTTSCLQSIAIRLTTEWHFSTFADNYGHQLTALDIVVEFENESIVPSFSKSLTRFCQLRRLRLTINRFSSEIIGNLYTNGFSRRCLKLKSLFISTNHLESITDCLINQLMDTLGKDLKQLKRLAVYCLVVNEFGNNNNKTILTSNSLKHMKQLTHLSLKLGINVINDRLFDDIDRHLPRLQYIDINQPDITRSALQSLSRLRHLNTVRLDYCRFPIASRYIIDDLVSAQPNLANVYISFRYCHSKYYRGNFIKPIFN